MKRIYPILVLLFFFASCNRKEFKIYKSVYDCSKLEQTSNIGQPANYLLTTGFNIEVKKKGKYVQVLGLKVHINDIEPNKTYKQGTDANYQTLRFSNDSIYYYDAKNLDGNITAIGYYGIKLD